MSSWPLVITMTAVAFGNALAEENSAQRLENSQEGIAEASWPRKPDERLSPLSGRMKENREISTTYYGQDREVRVNLAQGWQREARFGPRAGWEGSAGRDWENARWHQKRDSSADGVKNQEFSIHRDLAAERRVSFREVPRELSGDWSSRPARLGASGDGSLRRYEGRFTRVRAQVLQEEKNPRDLGAGRQEKFSPDEVEKMLSQPVGQPRGAAKERSPAASPLAAADN